MNLGKLKSYAPKARKEFIRAVTDRAALLGLTKNSFGTIEEKADVVLIERREYPKKVGQQLRKLQDRVRKDGFDQTMEAMAYTWFNRFVAIRFMELHGYLDHGLRVLSHPDGKATPEILEKADLVTLPGLSANTILDLKLDGSKDNELYRKLVIGQCNALSNAMPFLFELIDDETELLLPDNLLATDSIIRNLVARIDEEDWDEIEIIGWLYQFYISEKKEEVFAGLKKNQKITAENIPAATQLFTPHWIVRYLVENSLGRLWLLNKPTSKLAEKMDYYIAPEEPETDFLRIERPEEIRVCDPACGSGHMLTYAFDLLCAIYEEVGYDAVEIPGLILKHNLTGIEIDDRAGALAAFALAMKAAAKLGRRRFLRMEAKPDIVVLQDIHLKLPEFNEFVERLGHTLDIGKLAARISKAPLAVDAIWKHVSRYLDACAQDRFIDESDEYADHLLASVSSEVELYEEAAKSPFLLDQYKLATLDLLKIAKQDKAQADREHREAQFRNRANAETVASRLAAIGRDYERHRNDTTYRMDLDALGERISEAAAAPEEHAQLEGLHATLAESVRFHAPLRATVRQFEQAKNFGSLIVPKLRDPAETMRVVAARDLGGDLLLKEVQDRVVAVLRMTEFLSPKYHVVVANPPYAGSGGLNADLKNVLSKQFVVSKANLFSAFIDRSIAMALSQGTMAMVSLQAWLYLSSYEALRREILANNSIRNLCLIGYNSFPELNSKVATAVAFTVQRFVRDGIGVYFNLNDTFQSADKDNYFQKKRGHKCAQIASSKEFEFIPGAKIEFTLSKAFREIYKKDVWLRDCARTASGLQTNDNDRFIRIWHEVEFQDIGLGVVERSETAKRTERWYPHAKGGPFKKWFGNLDLVVNWEENGAEVLSLAKELYGSPTRTAKNLDLYFRPGVTWTDVSTSGFGARKMPQGYIFDTSAPSLFSEKDDFLLALINSTPALHILSVMCPSYHFLTSDIADLPLPKEIECNASAVAPTCERLLNLAISDDISFETTFRFTTLPLLSPDHRAETLEVTYARLRTHWQCMTDEMQRLEEENNRIFIDAYGLQDELTPEVPIEEITLTCNPAYRYGVKGTEAERETRLLADTMKELISYAIGCMFGRYSLDAPGLILANQGSGLAEYLAKIPNPTFKPDPDNVIPVLDGEWFADDIAARFRRFLRVTFGEQHFQENLAFVEVALGKDIRKYLVRDFFNDHVKRYKKRPIYWLFSSGKERAFQCLVYLHRYDDGTLARMRTEYVVPLQGRIASRIAQLDNDIVRATSTSHARKLQKELDDLRRQGKELAVFEEKLRHMADQRIVLDLDDGVKVNYGKFADLLAEVKSVTGGKDEE